MTPNDDLQRLYKIIKSSSRVREARQMFGLQNEEFIVQFNPPKGTVTTRSAGKPRKVSNDPRGDVMFFGTDVSDFVQRNIIKHFGLKLSEKAVMDAIFFQRKFAPRPFVTYSRVPKGSGRFKFSVELFEYPNADTRKAIIQEMDEAFRLLKEMLKGEDAKKLSTTDKAYLQVKKITKFDAKFDITKRYKKIQKSMRKGAEKDEALQALRLEAAECFNRSGMTLDDIRKEAFDFERSFGVVDA